MLDLLAGSPLLTITIVVGVGTLLGMIPFGPVKFGPAGALFVGLAIGALDPRLGQNLALVRTRSATTPRCASSRTGSLASCTAAQDRHQIRRTPPGTTAQRSPLDTDQHEMSVN
jgi:hypothetical protein